MSSAWSERLQMAVFLMCAGTIMAVTWTILYFAWMSAQC